ncbi:hypothetical protein M9H77_24257 [Catharanthus roseus]|uniref:Uncharacterized protein n=1 Tax=Catharanthus roseus TaxID=4058 RepID=A0ACC0AXS9_CATRO|nr:hypothetical protein M9H77_24257 [Catharanthus roseus]
MNRKRTDNLPLPWEGSGGERMYAPKVFPDDVKQQLSFVDASRHRRKNGTTGVPQIRASTVKKKNHRCHSSLYPFRLSLKTYQKDDRTTRIRSPEADAIHTVTRGLAGTDRRKRVPKGLTENRTQDCSMEWRGRQKVREQEGSGSSKQKRGLGQV